MTGALAVLRTWAGYVVPRRWRVHAQAPSAIRAPVLMLTAISSTMTCPSAGRSTSRLTMTAAPKPAAQHANNKGKRTRLVSGTPRTHRKAGVGSARVWRGASPRRHTTPVRRRWPTTQLSHGALRPPTTCREFWSHLAGTAQPRRRDFSGGHGFHVRACAGRDLATGPCRSDRWSASMIDPRRRTVSDGIRFQADLLGGCDSRPARAASARGRVRLRALGHFEVAGLACDVVEHFDPSRLHLGRPALAVNRSSALRSESNEQLPVFVGSESAVCVGPGVVRGRPLRSAFPFLGSCTAQPARR